MSLPDVFARIDQLQRVLVLAPATAPAPAQSPAGFSSTLHRATAGVRTASVLSAAPAGGTGAGQALLNAARAEVGVAEQPPGSNDSPRISQYRQATAGSGVGPWCAYFVSWAAREAGVPLGNRGQGFGRVDDVYAWAQAAGKAIPNGSGAAPQPGDLIVWDEHIGIVESVLPDGRIQTVEGNSSDQVSRRVHGADGDGALGYVRLG